ncbi:cell wall-binding repeat-containing protein [Actinoplanes sp. NPDC051513]|uniref:cell wall-binding repeat-containing protein n=1 Tax=Actinoplanes sp. NPDC051513 TaxID=3363908 RepID=UPI0037BBBCAB
MIAATAVAALGGGAAAQASFSADGYDTDNRVYVSNGGAGVFREGQSTQHPMVCEPTCIEATVADLQWSADGSRAVFINQYNQIQTYADSGAEWWGPTPPAGTQRKSPTFDSSGRYIIWSERSGPTQPWHLQIARASGSFIDGGRQWTPDDGYNYTNPDASLDGYVVYQRNADSGGQPTGTPEVWLADVDTGANKKILTDASQPTLGTVFAGDHGGPLAFVRSDGQHQQIYRSKLDGSGVQQLTTDAADHSNPIWAPWGEYLAYNVNGYQNARVKEDGSPAAAISSPLGVPTYRWAMHGHGYRLFGDTRFDTAVKTSQAYWGAGKAESVVLSQSDVFADALGGSALATAKHGPMLLTGAKSLNALTAAEMLRVLPKNGTVYLLGGPAAISGDVEGTIRSLGYTNIRRLAGATRYETSLAIANEISTTPEMILMASGANFPDALAAGAAAGAYNIKGYKAVVVLTNNTTLTAATKAYLDAHSSAKLFAIGGPAATATTGRPNLTKIVGATRYETAAKVADVFFPGTHYAGVASGENWPDALAGGALLGTLGGPLLLSNPNVQALNPAAAAALRDRSAAIETPLVFGGTAAVNDQQAFEISDIIRGHQHHDMDPNPTGLPLPPADGSMVLQPGSAKAAAKPQLGTPDAVGRR